MIISNLRLVEVVTWVQYCLMLGLRPGTGMGSWDSTQGLTELLGQEDTQTWGILDYTLDNFKHTLRTNKNDFEEKKINKYCAFISS